MWLHIFPLLLIHVAVIHGLLVVGPTFIRSNQDYKLALANFNPTNKINLVVRMEGASDNGTNFLNITKTVEVRANTNRFENFPLPHLVEGNYRITIHGQGGFNFYDYADLVLLNRSISGLIQLDKPVYKPGDSVHFRVIVLDTELKPPVNVKTVNVKVYDSKRYQIRKWSSASLNVGVFEGRLEIAPSPILGKWNIEVKVDGKYLVSKTFEVMEYVLTGLNVDVFPTRVPLQANRGVDLTVSAKNVFGQPVSGNVNLTLFVEDSLIKVKESREVHGVTNLTMNFNKNLTFPGNAKEVKLNFTFTEQYTNRTISKTLPIIVFKTMYRAEMVKETPGFRPEYPFKATIKLTYPDGSPAKGVKSLVQVELNEVTEEREQVSDNKGEIPLKVIPSKKDDAIIVTVSVGRQDLLEEEIDKVADIASSFVKIKLTSDIRVNQPIKLQVTMGKKPKFLTYYVLAKNNLVDLGFIRPQKKIVSLELKYSATMVPKSKVLVVTPSGNKMVHAVMDIVFEEQLNNFALEIEHNEVSPGKQLQLDMKGSPESYVALAAYDKSLLQHGSSYDLYWNDVQQIYEDFHGIGQVEHDNFKSFGLFAKVSDQYSIEKAQSVVRHENSDKPAKDASYRTDFAESFLWMNGTMDRSGHLRVIEYVPDSTTAWCITGFSMHPQHGLGVVKKTLQFNTIKAFYIVDHLPYSIKREEVVTLQFTIFNNLGGNYFTKVTLFNVQNQIEFMDTTPNLPDYSQVLTVPQKVGVPVSFSVKAKKLGEMAVRVKAMNMLESDAIEKVIRVMPESLVEKKLFSKFFNHHLELNESYVFDLPVDPNADPASTIITFTVNSNLLAPVYKNIGKLLAVPSGCGEQNMIKVVPNILLLDFLKASESEETIVAKENLKTGYQNQLSYRKTDGSFGVWTSGGGSVFLTAFVAQWFKHAANHIEDVDNDIITKAFEWLASKQKSSGRFDEVGEIFSKEIQGGLREGIALTSFVLIAFLENNNAKSAHSSVLKKSVEYVQTNLPNVNDLYDLSIATYALILNDPTTSDNLVGNLLAKATNEGDYKYWKREPHSVETTSYALLALIQSNNIDTNIVVPVMRWLVNQRYVTGSFPRTQDTFVGLKALTKLTEAIAPLRNDYKVQLQYQNKVETFIVETQDLNAKSYGNIPSDVEQLTVHVTGSGFGLLDVTYEYTKDLRNYKNRFDLALTQLRTNSDSELQLRVCANYIAVQNDKRSNMALVEVNFPSGYVVDNDPISGASGDSPIKKTEIRFGGASVILYYNSLGANKNCFLITAYRRFKVSFRRPAYVLVHDYYNPKLNAIQVYELEHQRE